MKVDYNRLREDFKTVEGLVKHCLKECPETRSSDRKLMLRVWELQGFRLSSKKQAFFLKVAAPETIRRIRQKLNEIGQYLPEEIKVAERTLFGIAHRKLHREIKNGH